MFSALYCLDVRPESAEIPAQQKCAAASLRCREQRPKRRSDVKQRRAKKKKRQTEPKHLHTACTRAPAWQSRAVANHTARSPTDVLAFLVGFDAFFSVGSPAESVSGGLKAKVSEEQEVCYTCG